MAFATSRPDTEKSAGQSSDSGHNGTKHGDNRNQLSVNGSKPAAKGTAPFPTNRVQEIYKTTYRLFVEVLNKTPEEARKRADLLTEEWRREPEKR